jgi:hypothetical protein
MSLLIMAQDQLMMMVSEVRLALGHHWPTMHHLKIGKIQGGNPNIMERECLRSDVDNTHYFSPGFGD